MHAAPLVLTLTSSAHHSARVGVPAVAELCGWAAGAFGVATGWPQAWRLWVVRRHEGLSLSSNVLTVLYATAWLLYGFASHSTVMVVTNLLGLTALMMVLCGHLILARPALRQWLPWLLVGWAGLGAMFCLGARPLGITASVATISGVLPQVVVLFTAYRRGIFDAAGVSRTRWAMSIGCNILWVSYGVIAHDPVIMVNSSIIAALSAAIVVLSREPAAVRSLPLEPEYAVAA